VEKDWWRRKDLRMKRNYDRKNKTLTVLEPVDAANDKAIKFEKPSTKISSEIHRRR
jgi:hypothetical protein